MTSPAAQILRLRTADVNMHNESPTFLCAGLYRLRAVFLWTLGAEGVEIDASLRSVIKIFRCVLRDRCARPLSPKQSRRRGRKNAFTS